MRLYKRGETWWCWFTEDGRQVRKSTRCRDKRAAESAAREFERIAADPNHPARQTSTVADAVTMLLAHRTEKANAGRGSFVTVQFYREKAGHWLRLLGPEWRLSHLTAESVDTFITTRRGEGCSENTLSKELVAMRAALKLMKRAGRWHGDSAAIFPVGFAPEYVPCERALPFPEVVALLQKLEPDRAARVAFFLSTGARLGESDRAISSDATLNEIGADYVALRGTKTPGAKRTVPIVTPQGKALLRFALEHGAPSGPLFRPWGKLHRDLAAACVRAGIDKCTPNDLRRTCATWLRLAGAPVELVAPMLGHVDIKMAMKIYARLDPAALGARLAATMGCDTGVINPAPSGGLDGISGSESEPITRESSGLCGARSHDQRIKSPSVLLPKPAKPHPRSAAARSTVQPAYRRVR